MKLASIVGWKDARRISKAVKAREERANASKKTAHWFEVHRAPGVLDRWFIEGSNALDHARSTGGFIWTCGEPLPVGA